MTKHNLRDLGLDYDQAAHGVQSAIKYEQENMNRDIPNHIKHLRTGLDCRAADAQGLAALLIEKGIFTVEEYLEFMRLAMNEELARYQDHISKQFGLVNVEFR